MNIRRTNRLADTSVFRRCACSALSHCRCSGVLVLLGAVILPIAVSLAGEDLTTLNGKVYKNISAVKVYPNQVVFTYNDERIPVALTNLPSDFCDKYGIKIATAEPPETVRAAQTNAVDAGSAPQVDPIVRSPLDSFLWQNRDADLSQFDSSSSRFSKDHIYKDWDVFLARGVDVILKARTTQYFGEGDTNHVIQSEELEFKVGQEEMISNMFNKFLEWDTIATTNHAENFQKEIAHCSVIRAPDDAFAGLGQGDSTFTFSWSNGRAELQVSGDTPPGIFDREDVICFQKFLTRLPDLKEKLAASIRAKEAQKDLFK